MKRELLNKRKWQDEQASIDEEMGDALACIDQARRSRGTSSFLEFIKTYMIGLLIQDAPSPKMETVIQQMESSLVLNRPTQLLLSRGSGKSSMASALVLYATATAKKTYSVIISANAIASKSLLEGIWKCITEKGTTFAQDFPELVLPFQLCSGSYRRRQLYRGASTEIAKNASVIQFARLQDEHGKELPTSRVRIECRSTTGGLRGMLHLGMRPQLAICDDWQTTTSAANPEQVEKLVRTMNQDVFGLQGKEAIQILALQTPIFPEDFVERLAQDKAWKTIKYPCVIRWPRDIEEKGDTGLWAEYFRLYDKENANDESHDASLAYYKENKAAMDEGAELFQPDRYKPEDGFISGLQAILVKRHTIGQMSFDAEYQLAPQKESYKLDISPKQVAAKAIAEPRLSVPGGYIWTVACADLNLSYAITVTIMTFKPDQTCHVVEHFLHKCHISATLPEAEYNKAVAVELDKVAQKIKALGIHIDALGVDASGMPFRAVCTWAKTALYQYGFPACALTGRANTQFNPVVRSRLRDTIHNTTLCGDEAEKIRAGAGLKWVQFNADVFKEAVHKALLAPIGVQGGMTLYQGADVHAEFALQVTNERLQTIKHGGPRGAEYVWRTREPHDYLDTCAMCLACAAQAGISGGATTVQPQTERQRNIQRLLFRRAHKPKVKLI